MALFEEMTLRQGMIVMAKNTSKINENEDIHAISYAAQSPWQSIEDKILFRYPFDEEWYNAVVEYCALKPDLEILDHGDVTEIGARGVSL